MLMMGLKLCIVPLDVLFWVTGVTRGKKKKEKGTAIRTGARDVPGRDGGLEWDVSLQIYTVRWNAFAN